MHKNTSLQKWGKVYNLVKWGERKRFRNHIC